MVLFFKAGTAKHKSIYSNGRHILCIVNHFIKMLFVVIRETNNNLVAERKYISNISRIRYQNLNDSRLILQLPLPNPLKPRVKSSMKM